MLDAKRLLDQFMGQQGGPAGAPGQQGLGQILGGNLGGLGNGLGGLGGGAVAGGLAALLLGSKQGRKLAGGALQLGGMAVVGALAYKAYQNWQSGQGAAPATITHDTKILPAPGGTPFAPSQESEQQALGRNLLRAMISAAKSDGHIDATEQQAIFAEMDKLPLDADDKAFVMDELRKPLDIDAVARGAATPEQAASIYTASLLAIDIDSGAERAYLDLLAARLGLERGLVDHLHATVKGATITAPPPAMSRAG